MFRKIFARVRSNNPDHDDQTPEVAHRLQNNQGTLPQKEELTSIATFSGDNEVKDEGAIEQATSKLAEKSVERPPQDASLNVGNVEEAKKSTMKGPSKRRRMVHEEIKRLEAEIKWRKEEIRATAEEAKPRRERIEELLQHMGVTERRKERMKEKREEFEEDRSEIAEERKWIAEIRDKIARQREQIGRYRGVIARSKDSTSQSEILELPMPEGLLVRRMNEREKELGLVEWKINLYEGYLNRKEVRLKRQELKVNLEEEEMNQRDKALEPELKELNQRMDDVNQLKEDIRSMKEQVRALKEINRQNSAQIIGYSRKRGFFRYNDRYNSLPCTSSRWRPLPLCSSSRAL
ncbi:hypothetical protein FRC03_008714 [Tulasnella sp. 419]|nr:hypothetical protein FRC03_008714 [Tulasnella sp. 419]